ESAQAGEADRTGAVANAKGKGRYQGHASPTKGRAASLVHRVISRRHTAVGQLADFQGARSSNRRLPRAVRPKNSTRSSRNNRWGSTGQMSLPIPVAMAIPAMSKERLFVECFEAL